MSIGSTASIVAGQSLATSTAYLTTHLNPLTTHLNPLTSRARKQAVAHRTGLLAASF